MVWVLVCLPLLLSLASADCKICEKHCWELLCLDGIVQRAVLNVKRAKQVLSVDLDITRSVEIF